MVLTCSGNAANREVAVNARMTLEWIHKKLLPELIKLMKKTE
jgi:hypothetical protein